MYESHLSSSRILRLPILVLGLAAAASCASIGSRSGAQAVDRITDSLVETAELRTDIRTLRVCVHWIHELNPPAGSRTMDIVMGHGGGAAMELQLHQLFIDSLSNRLHVIEFELAEGENPEVMSSGMKALVETFGVTHLVVGDFVRRRHELDVSIRLVDADTLLIVASASGVVPIAALNDDG